MTPSSTTPGRSRLSADAHPSCSSTDSPRGTAPAHRGSSSMAEVPLAISNYNNVTLAGDYAPPATGWLNHALEYDNRGPDGAIRKFVRQEEASTGAYDPQTFDSGAFDPGYTGSYYGVVHLRMRTGFGSQSQSIEAFCASLVISTSTGPGRPDLAR